MRPGEHDGSVINHAKTQTPTIMSSLRPLLSPLDLNDHAA
jgi:hypothetical protein